MNECVALNIKGVKCFIPNANYEYMRSLNNNRIHEENIKIKQLVENFISEKYDLSESLDVLMNVKEDSIFISTTGPLSALFFKGLYVKKGEYVTPELLASRISAVFSEKFDVKVIISIRMQSAWIPSAFAEWHQYYSKITDVNTFVKFVTCFKDHNHRFAMGINFENVVSPFERRFGKNNIYVAVFEQLQQDPAAYYSALINFMGGEIEDTVLENLPKRNVRETVGKYKRINVLNISELLYFYKLRKFPNLSFGLTKRAPLLVKLLSKIKWPSKDRSETIKMTEADKQDINDLYLETNKALSNRFDLHLEKYGYY